MLLICSAPCGSGLQDQQTEPVEIHCKQLQCHTSYVCKLATFCNVLRCTVRIQTRFVLCDPKTKLKYCSAWMHIQTHLTVCSVVTDIQWLLLLLLSSSTGQLLLLLDMYKVSAVTKTFLTNCTDSRQPRQLHSHAVKIFSVTIKRSSIIHSSAVIRISSDCRDS
jgi:hypothetical protein